MISRARKNVLAQARLAYSGATRDEVFQPAARQMASRNSKHQDRDRGPADISPERLDAATLDTAQSIAAHYALNPKSFRQRLRDRISWYRKPQDWTFASGSKEWRDMIAVAEEMTKRQS